MPTSTRRTVFTGLGLISPIGNDRATFWDALVQGRTGIRKIQSFDASVLDAHIAGEIPEFDGKKIFTAQQREARRSMNRMARAVQLGFCASNLAWEDANGPRPGEIDPYRYGVEFACIMVATDLEDLVRGAKTSTQSCPPGTVDLETWGDKGLREVPPQWMLKYLPNMPACHTSILVDALGPNNSITNGDAAGLCAIGEALRIIGRDKADAFLVGGCESKVHPLSLTRHNTFQKLSFNNANPTQAMRPFDAKRDGTVIGEGAVVYGMEELEFARKRGAKIAAEIVGFASGTDPKLSGNILSRVIENALDEAGIAPTDVGHVNAAGSGHPILDPFEARGIHNVFGTHVPVYAPKPHFGNMGAASGLIELAASVLALQHGELPGTLNHTEPATDCPIYVHVGKPLPLDKPYAVKISYTNMGQCAAVVIKRWDEE